MCLRRAPEKYIAGAALDRAGVQYREIEKKKRAKSPTMGCRATHDDDDDDDDDYDNIK
jgi:hypothetical protein